MREDRIVQTQPPRKTSPGESVNTTTWVEHDGKTTMTIVLRFPSQEIPTPCPAPASPTVPRRATATSTRCSPGSAGGSSPVRRGICGIPRRTGMPGFVPHAESLARDGASRLRHARMPWNIGQGARAPLIVQHAPQAVPLCLWSFGTPCARSPRSSPCCAIAVAGAPHVARADPATERGAAAYERAQEQKQGGKPVEAKRSLVVCSQPGCPAFIAKDCSRWIGEVEASTPSNSVIAAKDATGSDIVDVQVFVDERPLVDHLDGTALAMNPGKHTFRFEHPGSASERQVVVVREGEKAREIRVQFGDGAGSAAPDSPPPGDEAGVAASKSAATWRGSRPPGPWRHGHGRRRPAWGWCCRRSPARGAGEAERPLQTQLLRCHGERHPHQVHHRQHRRRPGRRVAGRGDLPAVERSERAASRRDDTPRRRPRRQRRRARELVRALLNTRAVCRRAEYTAR